MSEPPVIDACALIAYLWEEPGAAEVQAVFEHAARTETPCVICAVTWGEVLYVAARRHGQAAVPPLIEKLDGLPIVLVDADRDLTVRAAMLKAGGHLGYADAFCAALAQTLGAPVLACDADFDALARDGELEVHRIR